MAMGRGCIETDIAVMGMPPPSSCLCTRIHVFNKRSSGGELRI